jgi:hypothetical protein
LTISKPAPATRLQQVLRISRRAFDDLETGSGDQAGSSVDDLSSRVDDVEANATDATDKISAICDAFAGYGGAFQDIYLSAC